MESYDILANQPVVIDNVSMMMSFIHTLTEAAGCKGLLAVSLTIVWFLMYCVNRGHLYALATSAPLKFWTQDFACISAVANICTIACRF